MSGDPTERTSPRAPRELTLESLADRDRAFGSPLGRLKTKEQQVAEFLREGILGGLFERGQKLKQAEIADRLEISITPVREALKLLEAEGYVQISAHRGAIVSPFQRERVEELYDLRVLMEPRLTSAAATRLGPHDLEELRALDALMNEAIENRALESTRRAYNFRFHFRLYECADLPQTLHFVRVVWAKYPFDILGDVPERPNEVADEHAAILDALRDRDGERAATAMRDHIETGHAEFRIYEARAAERDGGRDRQ